MEAMSSSHRSAKQIEALDAFAEASASGTAYAQLRAAREADRASRSGLGDGLSDRQRALLFEAQTLLAMTDMRFGDAEHLAKEAAESWRGAEQHPDELAMRMAAVTARIGAAYRDTIAVLPLAVKLDHLLTALAAAAPTRRRLVEGTVQTGLAHLAVDRVPAARELFARARSLAGDDVELARALAVTALCELQAGNEKGARAAAAQAIALARSTGDHVQLAVLLRFMAGVHGGVQELTEALEMAEEAADIAERVGDVLYASTLRLRGMLRVTSGRVLEGCADLERSIGLLSAGAWTYTIPVEVLTLAQTLVGIGEHARAERLLAEHAEHLASTTGDERAEVDLLRYGVTIRAGDHARAGAYAENVGRLLAAAHHKDAATLYDAAADAWTIAQEPAHARRCRAAADLLRG